LHLPKIKLSLSACREDALGVEERKGSLGITEPSGRTNVCSVEVGGQLGFGEHVLLPVRRNRCKQKDASTRFAQKCDGEGVTYLVIACGSVLHDAATEKRRL
jgi:hypothetical protein